MELWKTIDIASNYEISNMGNIRNIKSGQVLNPGIGGNGYKQVSLKIIIYCLDITNNFYVGMCVFLDHIPIEHKPEKNLYKMPKWSFLIKYN